MVKWLTQGIFNPSMRVQFPLTVPYSPLYAAARHAVNVPSVRVRGTGEGKYMPKDRWTCIGISYIPRWRRGKRARPRTGRDAGSSPEGATIMECYVTQPSAIR